MDFFWHAFDSARHILLQCFKAGWTVLSSTEFISALSGAFFGAGGAYLLESRRRRREKRDREYEAFLRTQAVIISQGNSLGWVKEDYPTANSFDNLGPVLLGLTRQMVDFKDLAFIAKSSDAQLLIDLDVANERYDFFRSVLEARNAAIEELLRHPDKGVAIQEFLRAALEADDSDQTAGPTENEPLGDDIDKIMAEGVHLLLFRLRQMNRAVAERLDKAKSANQETMQRLLKFGQKEFPGLQVLSVHENASSSAPSPFVAGT